MVNDDRHPEHEHNHSGKEEHSMPSVFPKRAEDEKENTNLPDHNHQTDKENNKPFDKEQWNERARNAPGHNPDHFKNKSKQH